MRPEGALGAYFARWAPVLGAALERQLRQDASATASLNEAVIYLFRAGGKRFRPMLALLACELVGGDPREAIGVACAIECFHTSSLILDDLPCMDDARTRRGVLAVHHRYGEATAILAALALFNTAHVFLTSGASGVAAATLAAYHGDVGVALGLRGMIGGQSVDLQCRGQSTRLDPDAEEIRLLKTSALISAAFLGGAYRGGASANQIETLRVFGLEVGRAFQLRDDALDRLEDGDRCQSWAATPDAQHLRGRIAGAISDLRRVFRRRSPARDLVEEIANLAVDRRE